ncbi:MAG: histidine kinase dimerization/phospho-acceptor domain-containing protein [Syntrophales bacterium]|nr:histidine kinase dimerization/phospho-acceptor domain-containing protein [Syntrophales bacterium]
MDRKLQTEREEKIELNQVPVGLILVDEGGLIRRLNSYAERLSGDVRLLGSGIGDFFDPSKTRQVIGGKTFHVTAAPFRSDELLGTIYVLQSLDDVLREESANNVREASEMVAEIAHEIRNPLGSIELFASLLRKTASGDKDRSRLNQIILAVKTINERISELLTLSKKRALRRRTFSLNRLLCDIFRLPDQTDSFLKTRFTEREMNVYGDEKILRQMFLNLLIQMLQIMPAEAKLSVESGILLRNGEPYASLTFLCEAEGSIFQNLDLPMGLNLAIIHNIAQMHSGIVNIGSNSISILLPATEQ